MVLGSLGQFGQLRSLIGALKDLAARLHCNTGIRGIAQHRSGEPFRNRLSYLSSNHISKVVSVR